MQLTRPHQGFFPFALLGGALVLSGALAYAAVDASRKHRAAARAVLHDYVTFAAEQFAQRYTQDVEYYGLYPTMQLLSRAVGPLPEPTNLLIDAEPRLRQSLELATFFFRYHPHDGSVDTNASASLPSNFQDTLTQYVLQAADENALRGFVMDNVQASHDPRLIFFLTGTESEPTVVGFEARLPLLRDYSEAVFSRTQLLPASVTGDNANQSLFAIAFVQGARDTLWTVADSSAHVSPEETARTVFSLGENWPGMSLHVALLDGVSDQLVAGGVPTSRIPLTVTLAFMTAAMLIATVVQMLRERGLVKLRADFLSSVSHELRTPLAQIRMFAETLRLGRIRSSEERERSLAVIDKEARRLSNLVENVLLFSKPAQQSLTNNLSRTHLDPLVRDVIESYGPLAEARSVRFEVGMEPVAAPVDEHALKQAILNLIDNAVKYGPVGQTVRVSLRQIGDEARIAVEDEGPGVPPGLRAAIWKRFERLARDRESITTGTGIGLAVVRELMTLQRGRSWVEAGAVGARFVLALPNAVTRDGETGETESVRDESRSASRR